MKKCFHSRHKNNFGDVLNKHMFDALFDDWKRVKPWKANYFMIGSIIDKVLQDGTKFHFKNLFKKKDDLTLLGTGFIQPSPFKKDLIHKNIIPVAVRGETTKARLESMGVDCSETVLGDWGLIADKFVDFEKKEKKYDVGIIPHYVDKEHSTLKRFDGDNRVKILDISRNPKDFIEDVCECETVLSSAMHGLIIVDALKIPNLALRLSDLVVGGEYKFNDYYSVFGKKVKFLYPKDLDKIDDLKKYINDNYELSNDEIDRVKKNIYDCFLKVKKVNKK